LNINPKRDSKLSAFSEVGAIYHKNFIFQAKNDIFFISLETLNIFHKSCLTLTDEEKL